MIVALLPAPESRAAGESAWARTPESAVRLISAVAGTGALATVPLGLEFELAPGWKTYWRSPGDGGLPPELDWSGSENLAGAEIVWPAPHRFSILGIDSVGYEKAVVLPLTAAPAEPGAPLRLRLELDYLTCKDICIPQTASLALDLPAGAARPTEAAHRIDRWRGRAPAPPSPDLALESVGLAAAGPDGKARLVVDAVSAVPFGTPDLFVETGIRVVFGAPVATYDDGRRAARFVLPVLTARPGPAALPDLAATLTLVDGDRAVEQTLTIGRTTAPPPAADGLGLLAILGVALVGGLVLNLMPCVLPVLSLKLFGLLGHGGGGRAAARRSFAATAAGIVASFLLLAGAAIAVKAAGLAVGWGIQFQQPLFLVAMTVVLTLFAGNLWGLFEFRLPAWSGRGGAGTADEGVGGAFLTGMLATLLATPCSAPFVGTAVGFALARGPGEILAIFTALGIGLAAPYLAVAAWPRLATSLPRPGRWMVGLRAVLGLALVGTAVWLLTVLWAQAGLPAALAVAALGALALAALALGRRHGARWAVVAVAAAAALAAPTVLERPPAAGAAESAGAVRWQPFDLDNVARLVAAGRVVLVDVTADWCITCRVNKAAVLERPPVADRLDADAPGGVVPLVADWTRPNDGIAHYLASFGRYGIPFDVVYGPGAPDGIALPELLTTGAVLDAIDRAAGPRAAVAD